MLLLLVEEIGVGERADEEVVGGCGRSIAAGVSSRVWNPWTRASLSSDVGARKVAMIVYIYDSMIVNQYDV